MTSLTKNKAIRLIMYLRQQGITDMNVLNAVERVPRDVFVPETLKDQAWEDTALPIGRGQTISQPLVVAHMTQALALSNRDKVLEIGTGSGYQACILAKICRRVYSIERHKVLLDAAEEMFTALGVHNITAICGDGMQGWRAINGINQAPFDKIIVTAAAKEKPPSALIDQLKPGGIMVAPVGDIGAQVLKVYKKESEDTYSARDLMPVRFVPLLPDIAPESEGREESVA